MIDSPMANSYYWLTIPSITAVVSRVYIVASPLQSPSLMASMAGPLHVSEFASVWVIDE